MGELILVWVPVKQLLTGADSRQSAFLVPMEGVAPLSLSSGFTSKSTVSLQVPPLPLTSSALPIPCIKFLSA